jgi:ATP-dependent DNA ligase
MKITGSFGLLPGRFIRSTAVKRPFPEFIEPMMASVAEKPLDSPDWIFETKLDGFRAIAVIDSTGKVRLWSRNRLPLGLKFEIAEAVISSDQCFVRCRIVADFAGYPKYPKTCVQMRFRSFSISTLDQIRWPSY